jgi:ligand-binding SRPBCC domain-containing protein
MLPAPKLALKLLLGEMSTILLTGQKVIPQNFLDLNFEFKYRSIKDALREEVKEVVNGERVFEQHQWLPSPPSEVFPFFSDEYNLEKITPDFLGFKVTGKNTDQIQSGTLIDYKLKIHGITIKWKTEILEFVEGQHFVDQQLKGPYKKWFHRHEFHEVKSGTLMIDHVTYKPPFGFLGRLLAGAYIRKDVTKIFKYRFKMIEELYKEK